MFNDKLEIQIIDPKTREIIERYNYEYADIRSCLLSSHAPPYATFKLFIANKQDIRLYLFAGNEDDEGEIKLALEIFYKLHSINRNITPAKPLFLRPVYKIWLAVIIILLLINVILRLLDSVNTRSLTLTLPTFFAMIFLVYVTRINQKNMYDKMMSSIVSDSD